MSLPLRIQVGLSPTYLEQLVHEQVAVTAETAFALGALAGSSPQAWMYAQVAYDLWHAHRVRAAGQNVTSKIERGHLQSLRFGKHPPKVDYRTLRFRTYATAALPPPPPSYNVLSQVYDKLQISDPTVLFPMGGNDTLGNCTITASAHAVTLYRGLVGNKEIMAKQAVVKLYMHLTGGVDSGLNELDVLNQWRKHAFAKDKILAFASVAPKNHSHIQQAIKLFGGVYIGFQVQENCIEDFNAHKPWTPGPLTNDGHAVYVVAYDQTGVTVLTWGNTQEGTWAWWDECVDEAYAILPPEAKSPAFAPGFNLAQLQQDLQDVTTA